MAALTFYTPPCGELVRDTIAANVLGCIVTPKQRNIVQYSEWDVIADNGCFGDGPDWSHRRWFDWLLDLPRSVRFVVAPDVFHPDGSPCHDETLERWRTYGPLIERHGFTPAFVCQAGATMATVPDAPVLFLGGDDRWKEGSDAESITRSAVDQGRHVHMGRVNTWRRLQIAHAWGCQSVDGTTLTYGPDRNTPQLVRWLDRLNRPSLF